MPVVDPSAISAVTQGPEWQIPGIGPAQETVPGAGQVPGGVDGAAPSQGFGDLLTKQVEKLQETQSQGAEASRSLAQGTATDVASVVMDVERAKLSMQLAAQLRAKGTEAFQEVFRTQV